MPGKLVIVVHGVGDPMPGDALDAFAEGLCGALGYRDAAPRRVEHLRQNMPGAAPWQVSMFPVHTAVLTGPGGTDQLHLREVYWGDLSRVKGSVTDLGIAGVDLVFGLRHVVREAATEAIKLARTHQCGLMLARCGAWSANVALAVSRGPMFALNILVAVVCLAYLLIGRAYEAGDGGRQPIYWATLFGSMLLVAVGLLLRWRFARTHQWSTLTLSWLVSLGVVVTLCTLWRTLVELARQPIATDFGLFLWYLEDFVGPATSAMSAAAVAMALATGAAIVFCGVGWIKANRLKDCRKNELQRSLEVLAFCTALSITLFTFLAMAGWVLAMHAMNEHELKSRVGNGLHLFGYVWLGLAWLVVVFMVITWMNWWANKCNSKDERERYIVHPAIVLSMQLMGLCWIGLFIPLAVSVECSPAPISRHWPSVVCDRLSLLNQWGQWVVQNDSGWLRSVAISTTIAFAAAVWAFRLHLGTAIDLVLDVLTHFHQPDNPAARGVQRTRWNSSVARFQSVVASGVAQTNVDSMLVVAHSQGTLIAVEALELFAHRRPAAPPEVSPLRLSLVTMGSPVGRLYEHYFPRLYRLKSSGQASHVGAWRNIYRVDDFIGTVIGSRASTFPMNIPIAPRGHTDYWRDEDVLRALQPLL